MINAGLAPKKYRSGQIKIGDQVERNGKMVPRKLDGFRFCTHAKSIADSVYECFRDHAEEPRPWAGQWEVYTKLAEIDVALPPGALVIDQSMMRWAGSQCVLTCNGINTLTPVKGPCQCPQPDDPEDSESVWAAVRERQRLAGLKQPRGCKPHTWLRVMLPDVIGAGPWELHSTSENAASEILDQARVLEFARANGEYLPAKVGIEQRKANRDGQVVRFGVPVLRVGKSLRAIGEALDNGPAAVAAPLSAQLPPQRGTLALAAAPRSEVVPPPAGEADLDLTAQQLADEVVAAQSRPELAPLVDRVKASGLADDMVWVPEGPSEEQCPAVDEMMLSAAVNRRWQQLGTPAAVPAGAAPAARDDGAGWPDDWPASA